MLTENRKGFNTQYARLSLTKKLKKTLDNTSCPGTNFDLSKVFDTLNHEQLIARLYAYGISRDALKLIHR